MKNIKLEIARVTENGAVKTIVEMWDSYEVYHEEAHRVNGVGCVIALYERAGVDSDWKMVFGSNVPTVKIIDNREEFLKHKLELEELHLKLELGLEKETPEIMGKIEELHLKLNNTNRNIEYELVWE